MPEKISSACGRRSDTIAGHDGHVTLSKPIQTPSRSSCHVQQCPLRVPPSGLTVVRVNRVPRTVVAGSHFALSRSAARAEAADVVGEHVRIVRCMFSISSFFRFRFLTRPLPQRSLLPRPIFFAPSDSMTTCSNGIQGAPHPSSMMTSRLAEPQLSGSDG
jgi:hypothetical protein